MKHTLAFPASLLKATMLLQFKSAEGFELVLMSSPMNKKEGLNYLENFHIGFKQNTKEAVDNIFKKLKANGIAAEREPDKNKR